MGIHSSVLAWRTPWTEEPGGLQSTGSRRVWHNWSDLTCTHTLSRFSHVRLYVTSWTVAHQAPLSMGFSRQEYWSGFPCPPPGDCPDPGIEPMSPVLPVPQVDFLPLSHWGSPPFATREPSSRIAQDCSRQPTLIFSLILMSLHLIALTEYLLFKHTWLAP